MSILDQALLSMLDEQIASGSLTNEEAMRSLPSLHVPVVDNSLCTAYSADLLRAAVFNIERGQRLPEILAYLKYHPLLREADVIFANELDYGMCRTGNRDITREIAEATGMNYAYGIEFIELSSGTGQNTESLHGNAIFSRFPLENVKVIPLPLVFDWYFSSQHRIGARSAIFSTITVCGKKVGLICVHLENRTTPKKRCVQFASLSREIHTHFGDEMPLLIGGDMNTNTVDGDNDAEMAALARAPAEQQRRLCHTPAYEPMLELAAQMGFSYRSCNLMRKHTRRKPMKGSDPVLLNLDWFFERGLTCSSPQVVNTIFHTAALDNPPPDLQGFEGRELSDHNAVTIRCRL